MASEPLQELGETQVIMTAGADRVDACNALAWELLEQDPKQAHALAAQALELGRQMESAGRPYIHGTAQALITLGELANNADSYGLALTYLLEAYQLLQGQLFPDLLANASHAIGWAHFRFGNHEEAINFLNQALTFFQELMNREKEAAVLTSLGTTYSAMGDPAQAMKNFQQALLLQENQKINRARGVTLNNLAYAQIMLGAYDEAVKNVLEGIHIFHELGLRPLEAKALDTLGKTYLTKGELGKAEETLEQCLALSRENDIDFPDMEAMLNLGNVFLQQGRIKHAREHMRQAIKKAKKRRSNKYLFKYHEMLARLYESQGDLKNALFHYRHFHKAMDLALAEAANYRVENLKVLHHVEKRQKDSEVLRLHNQAMEREIDQRLHERATLEKLATTDPLTGLYNRRHFFTLGEYELEKTKKDGVPLSLIFVDIDHFKLVNDHYSHAAGDKVLIEIAKLFSDHARQGDVCCRYGGEEFVFMLPDTDTAEGLELAEQICQAVSSSPFNFGGRKIRITTSLGVAQANLTDAGLESLLARSDQALYRAKSSGRGRVSL